MDKGNKCGAPSGMECSHRTSGGKVSEFLQGSTAILTLAVALVGITLWASTHATRDDLEALKNQLDKHKHQTGHPVIIGRLLRMEQDLREIGKELGHHTRLEGHPAKVIEKITSLRNRMDNRDDDISELSSELRSLGRKIDQLGTQTAIIVDRLNRAKPGKGIPSAKEKQ